VDKPPDKPVRKTIKATFVRNLKPAGDVFDQQLDFNAIGQAVYHVLRAQAEKINALKAELFEKEAETKELRSEIRSLNKTLSDIRGEIDDIRESVRSSQGKFSLAEMTGGLENDLKNLLVETEGK
jgi:chromosome segregation ATPase